MSRPAHSIAAAAAALLLGLGCANDPAGPGTASARTSLPPLHDGVLALVGVHVIPMHRPDVVERDRTVIVRNGRIETIGPIGDIQVPADTRVVEGPGWLLPGLMDMHVHVHEAHMESYLRSGITTVRNMWGTPGAAMLRRQVADGARLPMIFSAGPGMDGDPPFWPGTEVLVSAGAAEDAVVRQAREGWDFIKVYRALEKDVYDAIVRTARSEGIGVIGHVPFSARLDDALAGMVSIEHLNSWDRALGGRAGFDGWRAADTTRARDYAERAAARGVWNCPTMIVVSTLAQQSLSPDAQQEVLAARQAVVRALHRAGAPLLAGTDAGIGITAPGSSLPQELEHLVAAGLTPYEALRAATADAARFLGAEDELGTIRPGMRADLVLVRGNPLELVGQVRAVAGVVLRGEWIELGTGGGNEPGGWGEEPSGDS